MDVVVLMALWAFLLREGICLFPDLIVSPEQLTWTAAEEYCKDRNGRLIVLDSQQKWNYFTAHDQYQTDRLNESAMWIGMRFNDSFSCKMKDKAKQWKFDGWGRWGRWNDLNVEPNGCPDKRCVRLRYNAMFTSWCSSLYQALCEADVSQTTSILTTTFSHTRAYTIEGVNEESVNSSTHFTISETTEASVDTMIPTTEAESVTLSDLTTISTSMTLVTSGVETDTCAKCCTVKNFTKLDQFELEESLHELRSQLAVNKTKLSVQRRKLISVYDPRPSSVVMGGVACSILAVIVGVIVLPDAVVSVRFVYTRFDRVHKRNKCFVV